MNSLFEQGKKCHLISEKFIEFIGFVEFAVFIKTGDTLTILETHGD